jgi:hypothetical protein
MLDPKIDVEGRVRFVAKEKVHPPDQHVGDTMSVHHGKDAIDVHAP